MAGLAIIHVVRAIVAAPVSSPVAFDLLIAAFGCVHFLAYRAQCFAEPVLTATTAGSTTASVGHTFFFLLSVNVLYSLKNHTSSGCILLYSGVHQTVEEEKKDGAVAK